MSMTRRLSQSLKNVPDVLADIAVSAGKPLELWFQDVLRRAQDESPHRPEERDHAPLGRTRHATLRLEGSANRLGLYPGAICPALGRATGLVPPFCNTEAMELHLQEIGLDIQPEAHAVLFVDQDGWHITAKRNAPENMTLVPLPSRSPELNPVEIIWQQMRDNWLSNRIFDNYDDVVDHCCFSWNKPVERPWLIMSIGMRD